MPLQPKVKFQPSRKKKVKSRIGRKIQTGSHDTEVTITDNPTKEVRSKTHKRGKITDLLSKYQALADKAGVDVGTMMKTLPRGSISLESVFSEDYKSVKVRVGLEMTFPAFDPKTAQQMYDDMAEKVEYIVAQNLREAREAAGI